MSGLQMINLNRFKCLSFLIFYLFSMGPISAGDEDPRRIDRLKARIAYISSIITFSTAAIGITSELLNDEETYAHGIKTVALIAGSKINSLALNLCLPDNDSFDFGNILDVVTTSGWSYLAYTLIEQKENPRDFCVHDKWIFLFMALDGIRGTLTRDAGWFNQITAGFTRTKRGLRGLLG